MQDELQRILRERYPLIFPVERSDHDPFGPVPPAFAVWGFECGDGWFDLLDALALNLQAATNSGDAPQAVAVQVKEKFGALRFYAVGADATQYAMIEVAETMSARLCEVCGNRGKLMSRRGWMMTRCPVHSDEDS